MGVVALSNLRSPFLKNRERVILLAIQILRRRFLVRERVIMLKTHCVYISTDL